MSCSVCTKYFMVICRAVSISHACVFSVYVYDLADLRVWGPAWEMQLDFAVATPARKASREVLSVATPAHKASKEVLSNAAEDWFSGATQAGLAVDDNRRNKARFGEGFTTRVQADAQAGLIHMRDGERGLEFEIQIEDRESLYR